MNELLSGRRILVVEDEILLSLTIEDMLADFGCKSVTAATTSEMAVALVEGQVFDAAVLDMTLNGESSRTVAERGVWVSSRCWLRAIAGCRKNFSIPEAGDSRCPNNRYGCNGTAPRRRRNAEIGSSPHCSVFGDHEDLETNLRQTGNAELSCGNL